MGVRNLWDILESCKTTLPLQHLQNKRVCVDLSCWVIQLQNASKSTGMAKEKVYLKNFFHRLRALIALNCSLIFVADGSIPSIKLPTYRQRLGSGDEGARAESNSQRACSHPRNMGSEFSSMIKEAKILGLALGIPCLDGLEEAEAQCALLNSESLCDGCFSADSDVFLFGARTVYRDIYLGEGGYVVCYEMADIERKLGFGRNSLISLAILLGSDYSQGVHGIGQETACRIVKSVGDSLILHRIASEGLAFAKTMKVSKKQRQVDNHTRSKENGLDHKQNISESTQNPVPDDQFMQVIDAYLKPKCHSPDSAAVLRLFVPHPFEHSKLQQICEQFFGWNPEKTDEYILPKIAERELRRFANLRFVSSELGVLLPLHKMPITCPVSAIIKERKVQGRECFEVSWEKIDGLKISIVPASLVESACPEKIAEFMERKAEGKQKKKSKPKKPRDIAAPLSEIDLRLQTLLLDAESPQNNFPNSPKIPEILQTGMVEPTHDMWNHTINQPLDTEVIDLCTPLPPLRACEVSKCQQPIQQKIHVINLSDSENEVSPEHEKQARELRLFIASVKDDIS